MPRGTAVAPEKGAGTDAVAAHAADAADAYEVDDDEGLLVVVLAEHYAAHWNPGTDLK